MTSFITDMASNQFLLNGLLAGILASLACGIVGPWVTTRRMVFLAGAIAHFAVAGIGAALYLRSAVPELDWLEPLYGATVAAVAGAILIAILHARGHEQLDTLIGATWAIGMSVGIVLVKLTPGYAGDLMSCLFGNLATVPTRHIVLLAALDVGIIATALWWHKRFLAICLDPEYAALRGVRPLVADIVLLVLTALTVVALMQVVGLILVLALLTLPAATAGHHLVRLAAVMGAATLIGMACTTLPRMAVYGTPIPPESAIVLAAGLVYVISLAIRRLRTA